MKKIIITILFLNIFALPFLAVAEENSAEELFKAEILEILNDSL